MVVKSVELKLREHFDRQGLGVPMSAIMSAKDIMSSITANQGCFVEGESALKSLVKSVQQMIGQSGVQSKGSDLIDFVHKFDQSPSETPRSVTSGEVYHHLETWTK